MGRNKPPSRAFRLLLGVACSASLGSAHAGATSTFDTDTEGWKLFGDSTTSDPSHVASGGNPGGYIHGTDLTIGGVWYWQAPSKFLGDNSGSYGQTLSFDLRMRGSGPLFDDADVILAGGGVTLVFDFAAVPADTGWTPYAVELSEAAGWRVSTLGGALATKAQIQAALGATTALRIRGEFITGTDNGDLDNVLLPAVPEPEAYALFLAGLGILGAAVKRRRSMR